MYSCPDFATGVNKHMTVIDLNDPSAQFPSDTVLVIGNFDAVHSGHSYLLSEARKIADEKGKKLAVLTIEPHPRRLFRPDDPPFRITPQPVKLERFEQEHIDYAFVLPFTWEAAEQSAGGFVREILREKLSPAAIVVGDDFHFGHNRSGNVETLRVSGFETHTIKLKTDPQHGIISATRIRGLIQSGLIEDANKLLGWDWVIEGAVQKGDQRGRELGYPTANVPLGDTIHPAYGVYATQVQIEGETGWRMAATNIGIRPMFEVKIALVEAHILDFNGDLYGKKLTIKPIKKIRDEEKFMTLDALIAQIEKDCNETREILSQSGARSRSA